MSALPSSAEPLLVFESAAFDGGPSHDCALEQVDLVLLPGELILLQLPPRALRLPLADAAQGLVLPRAGRVLFEGRTWGERRPEERVQARGRIGRVFEDAEWVSNLDVDENVILAACHHSTREEAEIVAEALALSARFGLSELPERRPGLVPRIDLRAFALVRAFLGRPRLLVLERPLRDARAVLTEPLAACLAEARSEGAAILWMTDDPSVWGDPRWHAERRFVVRPPRLELHPDAPAPRAAASP